jgi:hypothetical protein
MKKFVFSFFGGVSLMLFSAGSAFAVPIDNPDTAYQGATGKCTIDGTPVSATSTCTDGVGAQVNFTPAAQARQVGSSWGTWSSPPFSESALPKIAFFTGTMATLDYGTAALDSSVLGSEWEPNSFTLHTIVCSFQSAGVEVESVSRAVLGQAGARLFAVDLDLDTADAIVCSIPAAAQGFATAQIRGDGITSALASAASPNVINGGVNNGFTNAG